MRNNLIKLIFMLITFLALGCCRPIVFDGPYKGRVIDTDSGKPIEGVVVLGVWYKEIATPAGGVSSYYDADETLTDKSGNFEMKGKGLMFLTSVGPMQVVIFKAGYEHISTSWHSLKGSDYKQRIKWQNRKALITLRKLSVEEKRNRFGDYRLSGVPDKKQQLLSREVEKEYQDKYREQKN